MTEENWDHAFDNKLRGTVRCIRHAVPPMRERKWGRIVNISGGAAWTPQLGAITTGINNAAVQNLTVALANELGKDGILVNAIVPTAVRTDRHDKNIRETMAEDRPVRGGGAETPRRENPARAAWARRRRSPPWWSFWRPSARASSPAAPGRSTAAYRPGFELWKWDGDGC